MKFDELKKDITGKGKETTLMNELGKNHGVDYFSFYYN